MTADLATRLRARSLNFKIGSPVDELLREAADAIDLWRDRTVAAEAMVTSLTAERDEAKSRAQQAGMSVVAQDRLFDDLQDDLSAKGIELADTIMRLAVAEAERDNLVIAVTRCNDEHVLKSDLVAAEAECVAFAEVQQRHHDKLDAAERVVEIARTLDTCNLTPCAPCICSHHPWAGPLDHEAMCDDLRGELAEFDRLEKAYTAKERANKCDCDFCTPSGCRCCQGPRRGFVGRSENLNSER